MLSTHRSKVIILWLVFGCCLLPRFSFGSENSSCILLVNSYIVHPAFEKKVSHPKRSGKNRNRKQGSSLAKILLVLLSLGLVFGMGALAFGLAMSVANSTGVGALGLYLFIIGLSAALFFGFLLIRKIFRGNRSMHNKR